MKAKVLAAAIRPTLTAGDEIVVTDLDHETNVGPWRALEATGITIREWRYDEATLTLRIEDLEPLLEALTASSRLERGLLVTCGVLDDDCLEEIDADDTLDALDGPALAQRIHAHHITLPSD